MMSQEPEDATLHTVAVLSFICVYGRSSLQTQTGKASKFSGHLLKTPQVDSELVPFRGLEALICPFFVC